MDAGSHSISSEKSHAVAPLSVLQEAGSCPYMLLPSTASRNPLAKCHGDKFIPDRLTMDMDMAHYLLKEPRKDKGNAAIVVASPSKEAYQRLLTEKQLNNWTHILALRNKPPEPENVVAANTVSSHQAKPAKQRRYIPQSAERTLDAPELVDGYYLNLMEDHDLSGPKLSI